MKVGILTAARTNNNGTDLQAVAMQRIFISAGADAEIINYRCDKLENSHRVLPSLSVKNLLKLPIRLYNNINHRSFRNKYFKRSKKLYNKTDIMNIGYDRVVVGSDQIWNLDITGKDLNFFLPFPLENTKKFSYAASIGKTDITEWQEKYDLASHLSTFDGVSVREESGAEALDKIGVCARWDLDPLLMASAESWQEHIKDSAPKKPYILLYLVEDNNKAKAWAKKYAKKTGAEVLMINSGIKGYKGVRSLRFCSVDKWLGLVKNASLVVTNSYHGLAMAISFKTNFALFELVGNKQSNTRMISLVKRLGLESGILKDTTNVQTLCYDWKNAEQKLEMFREKSFEYINEICSEINEKGEGER